MGLIAITFLAVYGLGIVAAGLVVVIDAIRARSWKELVKGRNFLLILALPWPLWIGFEVLKGLFTLTCLTLRTINRKNPYRWAKTRRESCQPG